MCNDRLDWYRADGDEDAVHRFVLCSEHGHNFWPLYHIRVPDDAVCEECSVIEFNANHSTRKDTA